MPEDELFDDFGDEEIGAGFHDEDTKGGKPQNDPLDDEDNDDDLDDDFEDDDDDFEDDFSFDGDDE